VSCRTAERTQAGAHTRDAAQPLAHIFSHPSESSHTTHTRDPRPMKHNATQTTSPRGKTPHRAARSALFTLHCSWHTMALLHKLLQISQIIYPLTLPLREVLQISYTRGHGATTAPNTRIHDRPRSTTTAPEQPNERHRAARHSHPVHAADRSHIHSRTPLPLPPLPTPPSTPSRPAGIPQGGPQQHTIPGSLRSGGGGSWALDMTFTRNQTQRDGKPAPRVPPADG
jgi:hypothetical protein